MLKNFLIRAYVVLVELAYPLHILLRIHETGRHTIESTVNLGCAFLANSSHVGVHVLKVLCLSTRYSMPLKATRSHKKREPTGSLRSLLYHSNNPNALPASRNPSSLSSTTLSPLRLASSSILANCSRNSTL